MPARNPGNFLELSSIPLLRKVKAKLASELSTSCGVFNFESSYSGAAEAKEGSEGSMKSQLKFALFVALGTGVLGAGAAAQEQSRNIGGQAQGQYAAFDPNQAGRLVQVDHRRRCDGDGDRDDRGCYYQYQYPTYRGNGYYSNGYYVTPAPAPYYRSNAGWYDRDGRWHAYDRDRDRDRRRHDDDDRR